MPLCVTVGCPVLKQAYQPISVVVEVVQVVLKAVFVPNHLFRRKEVL